MLLLRIRKLTSQCRPRLALRRNPNIPKPVHAIPDSFECSRFRTRYRQALSCRNVSEGYLQIFRPSKANSAANPKADSVADQRQIQWQSKKGETPQATSRTHFCSQYILNRLPTEDLLLMLSVTETATHVSTGCGSTRSLKMCKQILRSAAAAWTNPSATHLVRAL